MNMRFLLAIKRLDRIRNEQTCKGNITGLVGQLSDRAMRGEAEMVWTCIRRRDWGACSHGTFDL